MKFVGIVAFCLVCIGSIEVKADDVTLDSVLPVVIKTVPEAGGNDIDPKLTEIKVTFSKNMQDGN